MVIHNTAAPTLSQWHSSPANLPPEKRRLQRMRNLIGYYRDTQGWSSGPHAFVDNEFIWTFTPFNQKGTHSPSWNGTALGIELVGDYDKEDDDLGPGLSVKKNAIALFAILHERLGLDPNTIKLHREDPKTTHACPGKDLAQDKAHFIASVLEYMGHGGEHPDAPVPSDNPPVVPAPTSETHEGVVNATGGLNLREVASASSKLIFTIPRGHKVAILGDAMNGGTRWLRVWLRDANTTERRGWVAARFVDRT